jgi:predicted MPP superfamily phosphohydrolase
MWRFFPWIFFGFIILRFVLPLRVGVWWKAAIGLALFLISQQRFISRTLFQSLSAWEFPSAIVILQGLMLSVVVFLTLFVILRDVVGITLWLCRVKGAFAPASSPHWALGICGAALLLSAVGVWQGVRVPKVRTHEIAIRNLPPELDGFTIAQLTDLHITALFSQKWVRAVVDKTNAIEPDLVLITGDIVDGRADRRLLDVVPLAGLRANFGVFAVPGNHEYYSGYEEWMDVFNGLGVRMLQNEHTVITRGGSSLLLAGITDLGAARRGGPAPDINAALATVHGRRGGPAPGINAYPAPEGMAKILMSHQPGNARESASAGIDLQLSGHTHGGQIAGLHFIVKYANGGFASGQYDVGNMKLYVSNGTGLWPGFPIRLGVSSEIALIVLKSSEKPSPLPQ